MSDTAKPEGLSAKGEAAYKAVMKCLTKHKSTNTGGCKVFYSPDAWKERGESYGTTAELIVVHDGGDHAGFFNSDYMNWKAMEAMREALNAAGLYVEGCTCWYSAVYLS